MDTTGRANGRGAYLCRKEECLEKAIRGHGLERSFRQPVPEGVTDLLREEWKKLDP